MSQPLNQSLISAVAIREQFLVFSRHPTLNAPHASLCYSFLGSVSAKAQTAWKF